MDRCIYIVLNKALGKQNSILVVVTFPCHEADQRVLAESKLSVACGRTVSDDLSCHDALALIDDRFLVVAVALVTAGELDQMIVLSLTVIVSDCDICRAYK